MRRERAQLEEKMKSRITSNLMLKIISIVVAFIFWLMIINVTDPTMAKTFYGIPVKVLNENVITSANQVYEIAEGDKVDVTVKGKRSFVESLKESDFTATADLSGLSKVNAVSIDVKMKKQSNSNVEVEWGNAVMKVKLEERVTQKFRVEVEHEGELSENYVLGDIVAKPNIVEVSCGKSKFKKIDHVGVLVTLNGESEDFEKKYKPVLYNADGEALGNDNVIFSNDRITVGIEVLQTKEIPIYVEVTGTPAEGYRLVQTDFMPGTVQVSGSREALKKATSVKIQVSVDNAKKDVEKEIGLSDLSQYLPSGLSLVGDTSPISVRCVIEKNGTRSFVLTAADIAVKNLPANCTIEFSDDSAKYTAVLSGTEEVLQGMTLNELGAFLDLSGMGEGVHTLEVQFALPATVELKHAVKVQVILSEQGDGAGAPESDDDGEDE